MTPVFCCGGECGRNGTSAHWGTSSLLVFDTSVKRNGGYSMKFETSSSQGFVNSTSFASNSTTFVARVYVYFGSLPTGGDPLLMHPGGAYIGIRYKASDGKLYLSSGSTTPAYGSDGIAVTTGQWYKIDLKAVTATPTWTLDAKVNGVAFNQYTVSGANISQGTFALGLEVAANTGVVYFDDVICSQTAGDYPISDGHVDGFVPTADGSHNAGSGLFIKGAAGAAITNSTTDAYLLIDEVPISATTPDTDDYINQAANGSTNYTEHIFGPGPSTSSPTAAPRMVDVLVGHHQAGTQTGVSAIKLNDNGTEDTIFSLSGAGVTTVRYARKGYTLMPADSAAWTLTRFNDLRVRFGYSSDANPDQYFDFAFLEAEFETIATSAKSFAYINGA